MYFNEITENSFKGIENLRQKIAQAHLLDKNNQIEIPYNNISELLTDRVKRYKGDNFITFYSDDEDLIKLNYKEFYVKVNQLANLLISEGVKKGHKIATYSYNHIDTVILYFACWLIGAIVVPININEEDSRILYILNNSNSKIIFTRENLFSKLNEVVRNLKIIVIDKINFSEFSDELNVDYKIYKETEALIVYTSGTTGNPKGVVLTHYNLLVDACYISEWHKMIEHDSIMCVLPIHHVNGTVVTIMAPLYAGARIILNQKFHTNRFFNILESEKVKIVSVVPTLLQFLIHSDEQTNKYNLTKFSHIICGAGPLTCELARSFEKRFSLKIVHGYGLSETTCYSCFIPMNLDEKEHYKWQNEYGFPSIGIPLDCNDMDIQNENGNSLGENEKGEIVIKGLNVMKNYFDNEEANEFAFKNGWFRSGDEGFYKTDEKGNKYFFISGRIKELIIRGGVNISPFEIDEVLSDCPYIISGISVGFENSWYGEEIGAVVILKDEYKNGNREHLESEIKKYCWKQLPFNKVPKVIKFLEELPVTSTGKYQRNRVKDLFEEYKDKRFLRFAL